MATGTRLNQGKTAFLEKFLPGNRDASLEAVNKAWTAAGNEGQISESLYGKIRRDLGLTAKRGTDGVATAGDAGPAAKVKTRSSPKGTRGNRASKAETAPSQPGDSGDGPGPNRTAFVEEALRRNPKANVREVNDVWKAAGNEGKISDSVFYKVKRERGGNGEGTQATPAKSDPQSVSERPETRPTIQPTVEARPEPDGVPAPSQSLGVTRWGDRERVLDRVEDRIDDLIIELKQLGGMEEALEALRKARRVVVRSHES